MLVVCMCWGCGSERSVETPGARLTVKEDGDKIQVSSEDGSIMIEGSEDAGYIKIKTDEGENIEVSYNNNKLMPDFPPDIPIYQPSSILMNQVFKNGANAIVSLSTTDSPETVYAFYEKALAEKGWVLAGQMSVGEMKMLQGKKGDFGLTFSLVREQDTTKINIAKTEAGRQDR